VIKTSRKNAEYTLEEIKTDIMNGDDEK